MELPSRADCATPGAVAGPAEVAASDRLDEEGALGGAVRHLAGFPGDMEVHGGVGTPRLHLAVPELRCHNRAGGCLLEDRHGDRTEARQHTVARECDRSHVTPIILPDLNVSHGGLAVLNPDFIRSPVILDLHLLAQLLHRLVLGPSLAEGVANLAEWQDPDDALEDQQKGSQALANRGHGQAFLVDPGAVLHGHHPGEDPPRGLRHVLEALDARLCLVEDGACHQRCQCDVQDEDVNGLGTFRKRSAQHRERRVEAAKLHDAQKAEQPETPQEGQGEGN
mmetsp:Transcript_132498/g.369397  ORF Transcript_132498/g.369397 Transcript_132498/m.369397 type:complete len:280 (-) Transcript_132498:101-940(-)